MDGQRILENSSTSSASTVQEPGEKIRPVIGEESMEHIVQKRYGLTVTDITELSGYDDRNFYIQVNPQYTSPTIHQLHTPGYVVKIYNKYVVNAAEFDMQHAIMACLNQSNIVTQKPVPNLNGNYHSLEDIYPDKEKQGIPGKHYVEMRTYIPGRIIKEVPSTIKLMLQTGRFIATMTKALQDLDNTYLRNRDPSSRLWSLTNVPLLTKYTFCLSKEECGLVNKVISDFKTRVVSQYKHLPRGYIHGDTNNENILVAKNTTGDEYNICGVIDFADAEYSFPVIDLAVNIVYMMLDSDVTDQLDTPGYILAGYLSVRTLTEVEWDVLVPCVAGRLALSLTLGAHARYIEPGVVNIVTTEKKGWPLLKTFYSEYDCSLISRWKTIISSFQELQK